MAAAKVNPSVLMSCGTVLNADALPDLRYYLAVFQMLSLSARNPYSATPLLRFPRMGFLYRLGRRFASSRAINILCTSALLCHPCIGTRQGSK